LGLASSPGRCDASAPPLPVRAATAPGWCGVAGGGVSSDGGRAGGRQGEAFPPRRVYPEERGMRSPVASGTFGELPFPPSVSPAFGAVASGRVPPGGVPLAVSGRARTGQSGVSAMGARNPFGAREARVRTGISWRSLPPPAQGRRGAQPFPGRRLGGALGGSRRQDGGTGRRDRGPPSTGDEPRLACGGLRPAGGERRGSGYATDVVGEIDGGPERWVARRGGTEHPESRGPCREGAWSRAR